MLGAISHELLTPKSEWPAMRRRLKERLAGKEDTYELEHVRSDGGRHWVSVRAMPYRNARGDIVGTIGLMSCIKERKSLEFENEYLQEELRGNYRAILGDSPALKKVLEERKILMVDDEIQMGFFRAGKFWAIENFDVSPDIVVFGKIV